MQPEGDGFSNGKTGCGSNPREGHLGDPTGLLGPECLSLTSQETNTMR
jgi:hypothetical protein